MPCLNTGIAVSLLVAMQLIGSEGFAQQSDAARAAAAKANVNGPNNLPGESNHPRIEFFQPDPLDFNQHEGYVSLFDGKTLDGWDGDPKFWRVQDGAIVGETSQQTPISNTYISYPGLKAKDFTLKLEIKVEKGGGSGIQYRSSTGHRWIRKANLIPSNLNWLMTGPQADFWYPVTPLAASFTGQFYTENTCGWQAAGSGIGHPRSCPLGILAWRGQVVASSATQKPRLMGIIGDRDALGGYVKVNDWNQYTIIARGGVFIHIVNGQLMAVYVDDDPNSLSNQPGTVGIELEQVPTKLSVRNIWIQKLDKSE